MDMQLMVKPHLAGHDSKSHILYIYISNSLLTTSTYRHNITAAFWLSNQCVSLQNWVSIVVPLNLNADILLSFSYWGI